MKIFLVINNEKCKVGDVVFLRELIVALDHQETEEAKDADFIAVLGGDGTIINTARMTAHLEKPIAGINFGKLGYLATFSMDSFRNYLSRISKESDLSVSHRMMLHVYCMEMNKEWNHQAVNDIVLDIGPPFRTIELQIEINGIPFSMIRGDGIIISTPTGSTAYCMSAGGPIVQPELDGIILTPKNPHRLSIRPIVVSPDAEITIKVPQHEGAYAVMDGQVTIPLNKSQIVVKRAEHSMLLLQDGNYWQTLTEKLKWGQ